MRRVVIIGAGGRDFHNFNTVFRDDPSTRLIAFTAAQILASRAALTHPRWLVRATRTVFRSWRKISSLT